MKSSEQRLGLGLPDQAPHQAEQPMAGGGGRLRHLRGDLVGGFTSAVAGIPIAMGYGMLALSPLGADFISYGVLAGLYAVICGGIVAVLLGANTTMIYGPRSIVTYMTAALVLHTFVQSNAAYIQQASPVTILTLLFFLTFLAGIFQILFGLIGLGGIVRYIPAPVMAGFQNAAAALIFSSQLGYLFGVNKPLALSEIDAYIGGIQPLTLAIGVFVCIVILKGARITRRIPPTLLGLFAGIALYYLFYVAGLGGQIGPTIGTVPFAIPGPHYFPAFFELLGDSAAREIMPSLLSGALSLAIIASLDGLLCARLVETDSGHKVSGKGELIRLGAGNMVSAAFGGIANGINLAASFANHRSGGRTANSILINAATVILGVLVLPPVIAYIPRVIIAAMLTVVAIQLVDRWTLQLLIKFVRGKLSPGMLIDLVVILTVTTVAIVANIVIAVLLGVIAAIVFFIFRMSRSVIRRSYYCDAVHSRKAREERWMTLLTTRGRSILVIELEGALFFGTADNLAQFDDKVIADGTVYVILDLRRVNEIDSTGARILLQMHDMMTRNGRHLLLAGLKDRTRIEHFLHEMGVTAAVTRNKVFEDADHALEWAEDHLILSEEGGKVDPGEFPFQQLEVFAGFSAAEVGVVTDMLEKCSYETDAAVFREGDTGRELFIIASGSASVYLRLPGAERATRLITFTAGTIFGEVALLDDEVRSATVEADSPLVCYVLRQHAFETLSTEHPMITVKLLRNLGRVLSGRLRRANRTIYQRAS